MDDNEAIEICRAPVNRRAVLLAQARQEIVTSDVGLRLAVLAKGIFVLVGFGIVCVGLKSEFVLVTSFGIILMAAGAIVVLVELRNQRRMRELELQLNDQQ